MKVPDFQNALKSFCDCQLFRPFVVKLKSGNQFEVDAAGAVSFRDGFAGFITADRRLVFFDHESVSQFIAPMGT